LINDNTFKWSCFGVAESMNEESAPCNSKITDVGGVRKLIVNCKDCSEDFSFNDCLKGLVLAFQDNYDVESLVLSDFIETQFIGDELEIIEGLRQISDELDRLSARTGGADCAGCEIEPKKMYSTLKDRLLTDHENFYQLLSDYAIKIIKKEGCEDCRRSAKEEFTVLGKKVLEYRSKILLDAYGILR